MSNSTDTILKVDKLAVIYSQQGKPFIAVNKVSFDINKGEIFGLVGESGSGKTTIGRTILGLNKHALGHIKIKDKRLPHNPADIKKTTNEWLSKNVQMIFQDPATSLNPSKRVLDIVLEGFNNYNSYSAEAKWFKKERKIALIWYRKLTSCDEKIIKQYDLLVAQLINIYQQWYRTKENMIKSISYESQDIVSSYRYSLKGAKTKHRLLIATRNDVLKKEQLSYKNDLQNLSGIKKWNRKWDKIFNKKITPLKDKKELIEKEIYQVETIYKEKLNEALIHLNDIQERLTYENDNNLMRITNLINFHQETINSNLQQLQVRKQEIDSFYTKDIRIAEKKNNLKEVKKLRNIWKSDWKVTKLEIDLQNREEKNKINLLQKEGTRYKYQLLYDTRNDVYEAKQELKQIRKQERIKLIKISQDLQSLMSKLNKQKQTDRKNFISEAEQEIIFKNYYNRVKDINVNFNAKIEFDKKQIDVLKTQAWQRKLARKRALKNMRNDFKLLKIKFGADINTVTTKLQHLLKLPTKTINKEKTQQIIKKYKSKLRVLKKGYVFKNQDIKKILLQERNKINSRDNNYEKINEKYHNEKYQGIVANKKTFVSQLKELVTTYEAKLYGVNLYKSKKLFLDFQLANEYSRGAVKAKTHQLAYDTLQSVGLLPEHGSRFSGEFSGGQKQRIGIARTLVMKPALLVADEPISALDVSIQSQVINILKDLREKYQLSILLIAHDLRMVHYICDRIAVIKNGKILEIGLADEIFYHPVHPYTKSLISAIPSINRVGEVISTTSYNPLMHNYNEKIIPMWHNITNTHQVLATVKEFKKWSK